MPRPIPEYVPPSIRDIIYAKWGDQGLRGLADHAQLEYRTVIATFSRTSNRSLFKFQQLCRKLGITMEEGARILQFDRDTRRAKLMNRIEAKYGSVQEIYRKEGISDTYIENLYRTETGERVYAYYAPLAKALGLNLDGLTIALDHTKARRGYRRRESRDD